MLFSNIASKSVLASRLKPSLRVSPSCTSSSYSVSLGLHFGAMYSWGVCPTTPQRLDNLEALATRLSYAESPCLSKSLAPFLISQILITNLFSFPPTLCDIFSSTSNQKTKKPQIFSVVSLQQVLLAILG